MLRFAPNSFSLARSQDARHTLLGGEREQDAQLAQVLDLVVGIQIGAFVEPKAKLF